MIVVKRVDNFLKLTAINVTEYAMSSGVYILYTWLQTDFKGSSMSLFDFYSTGDAMTIIPATCHLVVICSHYM